MIFTMSEHDKKRMATTATAAAAATASFYRGKASVVLCLELRRCPQSIQSSTPFCTAWKGKLGWTLMLNAIIAITYTFTFLAPLLMIVTRLVETGAWTERRV